MGIGEVEESRSRRDAADGGVRGDAPASRFEQQICQVAFLYYPRLQRLKSYIEAHYDEPITLGTAARVACLEETYFSKFFRRKTGVCFRDWLGHVRIARASELLRQREESIGSVGEAVGFDDPRTFQRTFKRHRGMTPSTYRLRVRPIPPGQPRGR